MIEDIILVQYEIVNMKIFTKESDYAIQLLAMLAQTQASVSLRQFAERSRISFLFLQRIARKLRVAELIEATQGRDGGYRLARSAGEITLKEVTDAIEGKTATVACLSGQVCPLSEYCVFPKRYALLDAEISDILSQKTLAQFVVAMPKAEAI